MSPQKTNSAYMARFNKVALTKQYCRLDIRKYSFFRRTTNDLIIVHMMAVLIIKVKIKIDIYPVITEANI